MSFGSSFASADLVTSLRGSVWQGSFETLSGTAQIKIEFLEALSAGGELQYFHQLLGNSPISEAVGPVDKACEFTPRALAVHTDGTGIISVYPCAESSSVELQLAASPLRKSMAKIAVKSILLSEDENSLQIVASILGTKVIYTLERKNLN